MRRGANGPAVLELQRLLGMERVSGAGTFGPRTEQAVLLYQKSRGLVPDGIVGAATWTALHTAQPVLASGTPRPQKVA
jgi:peptidoglycan hydrolase-like protein with peptidoglycan-binding domain